MAQPVTVYGPDGYPMQSTLTEAQKNANMEALNLYRLGWGSGDHTIILGVTNSPTFNFYWVTETDPVYGDRFPTFFGNFKREAEEASGKPYSMRFDNIIHREINGTYYEAADWIVDGYDRGVYWLCAKDGLVLWDTATTGNHVAVN
eukprot:TRINITY_DN50050_c0_g1_i1.p1 TRINITY_DN50050_c0_g1~~TRINITY_DN50050_c0_g1_i1.p1  ORF type:complete len:161 (-),score=26.16 TRINITY_DN50050_c0_g1_i1:66-503(-)